MGPQRPKGEGSARHEADLDVSGDHRGDRGPDGGGAGPARQHPAAQGGGALALPAPGRAGRLRRGPGALGEELPARVRRLPAHRGHPAHALRRQRGLLQARDRPGAQAHLRRLRLRRGFPRGARARLLAHRPAAHPAHPAVQAAGRLPALPRRRHEVGLREGRRRRPHGGLRQGLRHAACRRLEARQAPHRLRGLPRPQDHAAARHAPGLPQRHPGPQGRARRAGLRPQHHGHPPGDALLRLRPVPRRVLLPGRRQAGDLPVAQRPRGGADRGLLRQRRLQGLGPRRDRRPGAQGAAPRVRDVEPGHPRPQRRGLRRLPHALQARGRAQDHRPPRAQPAARPVAFLPQLPQLPRGGDAGAGRGHTRANPRPADARRAGLARPHGPGQGGAWPGGGRPGSAGGPGAATAGAVAAGLRLPENSLGFHAPQEAARILAEAIDYARQGETVARAVPALAGR